MELTTLKVEKRETASAGKLNDLRTEGKIPASYYGKGIEPVSLSVADTDLAPVYGPGKRYTLFDLDIDGTTGNSAIIYDVQRDIISGAIVHIDFLAIAEDRQVKVVMPVKLEGVPYGVKTEGGTMLQDTKKVTISCLPSQIPTGFVINVDEYKARDTFYAENLDLGEATLVTAPRAVIFTISKGRKQ